MTFSNKTFSNKVLQTRSFSNRTFQKPTGLAFVTVQIGNFSDASTWNVVGVDGIARPTSYTPNETNSIFLEHAVTMIQNQKCKDLNVRIDTTNPNPNFALNFQTFDLEVWGFFKNYAGTAAAPVPFVAGSGQFTSAYQGAGGITIRGLSRQYNFALYVASSVNAGPYYTKINLTDSSQTLTCANIFVGGEIIDIIQGVLLFPGTQSLRSYRTNTPSNLGGDVFIRSGGKLMDVQDLQTSTAGTEMRSFTIDAGGLLEFGPNSGNRVKTWRTLAYTNNGTITYSALLAQTTITPSAGAATLVNNANIVLSGSAKTLNSALFIQNKLSLGTASSIVLNAKTLTYDTNGNLEILVSLTKGNELPASGAGVNICKNIVAATGINYNLNTAIVNIRGILTGGGSTSNGTLNQNQP